MYHTSVNNTRSIGKIIDSRVGNIVRGREQERSNNDLEDTEDIHFKRSLSFKQYIKTEFDKELNGIRYYHALF